MAQYTQHLQSLVSPLPTSLEEDQQLVSAEAGAAGMTPRHAAAVRCRMEWKAMVHEGLHALGAYGRYLEASTLLKGRRY